MIKVLIICLFISFFFFQCEKSDEKKFDTTVSKEMLLGLWQGTDNVSPYPVYLTFKDNQEAEFIDCNYNKGIKKFKYDFYQEDGENKIKFSNEIASVYPWMNEYGELRFDYRDKLDRPDMKRSLQPVLSVYVFKKASKMSCEEKLF